ncbi:potassium channel family protein [Allobaculum mucilyticum]|uniref:potassium channel family protein n=1 Tax=Allobaculum mucilyticum TaxID=2834459 RepID=UPI001E3465D1|nr:TrkA family potassium uptake protein [Allobaculum mucilyticum]UNT96837.1 TrkA family potassium uptake protein [Allobaculum mucilyticum]
MFFKGNKQANGAYAVIGLGRFGSAVATTLVQNGEDVIIVDKDPDRVRELRYLTDNAYVINHLDQKSLEEIGVADCKAAIIAIGSQIDANILATLYCINLKVPTVIAKANTKDMGSILEKLGAQTVYPEWEMGERLANQLSNKRVIDYFSVSGNIDIAQINAPRSFVGKQLKTLALRQKYGISIIAIQTSERTIEEIDPDYVFEKGDIIIIIGSNQNIRAFEQSAS